HRHNVNDAGPASDEQPGPLLARPPDEVASDRSSQLERVALLDLAHQVLRNLSVVESLHCDRHALGLRRRSDRVAALRLVAVLRREPDIDVLAGKMAWPAGGVKGEARDPRRLRREGG